MIKKIANPFFIAFIFPFVFATFVMLMQFNLPEFNIPILNKTLTIPSGGDRLTFFAGLFYEVLSFFPESIQAAWVMTYGEGQDFIQPLFAIWLSLHVGLIAGTLFCSKRWLVMVFTRQYEKQSLISDRKLMK